MTNPNMPLVSVIMPCYNQGIYIEEAIQSVLAQTYPFFEIIVVNDGSTDPYTTSLLDNMEFPKTRIIHTTNQNVSAARNNGLKMSRGELFLPLDADDKIGPDYLRQAVNQMQSATNVGIVFCQAEYFGMKRGPVPMPKFSVVELLTDCGILCCAVFRKNDWETVGGYKTDMCYALEDYDYWISIVSLGREVIVLPECHFFYRIKNKSRSVGYTEAQYLAMRLTTYQRHREFYLKHADELFEALFRLVRRQQRPFWHPLAKTMARPIGLYLILQWHRFKTILQALFRRKP